jgi:hypothetical protein
VAYTAREKKRRQLMTGRTLLIATQGVPHWIPAQGLLFKAGSWLASPAWNIQQGNSVQ